MFKYRNKNKIYLITKKVSVKKTKIKNLTF